MKQIQFINHQRVMGTLIVSDNAGNDVILKERAVGGIKPHRSNSSWDIREKFAFNAF